MQTISSFLQSHDANSCGWSFLNHGYPTMKLRWIIRRDHKRIIEIERLSFDHPWSSDHFVATLTERATIGILAEDNGDIMGFSVYTLHDRWIELQNLAVDPKYRRNGVATCLVQRLQNHSLKGKGGHMGQQRQWLEVVLRESNIGGLLFFRQLGFAAVSILKQPFTVCDDDAIVMVYDPSGVNATRNKQARAIIK